MVNVEETLQKLLFDDETFEDPAILDLSRKVTKHKLNDATLYQINDAPAYPNIPRNLLETSKDIWSSNTSRLPTGAKSNSGESSDAQDPAILFLRSFRYQSVNGGQQNLSSRQNGIPTYYLSHIYYRFQLRL